MTDEYAGLISPRRAKPATHGERSLAQEAASDRSRILYSSAFRRLQQKTQVFPLSKNAAVRSRLTHSLEVADIGSLIARSLTRGLLSGLDDDRQDALVLLVETACLMHDIGNPPFGHFAEVAIQKWFGDRDRWRTLYERSLGRTPQRTIEPLARDFVHFDGNPQGVRVVTRLQGRTTEERLAHGMNLTYSQILSAVKYPRSPSQIPAADDTAKPGFFESERGRIAEAREALGIDGPRRMPMTYIAEAADDIAYCLSDIEDGIETDILDAGLIMAEIRQYLPRGPLADGLRSTIDDGSPDASGTPPPRRNGFIVFKTEFTPRLIAQAVRKYTECHDELLAGERESLFRQGDEETELLESLKTLARQRLYSSKRVEQPLRMGLGVMTGLLERLAVLLAMPVADLDALIDARVTGDRGAIRRRRLDPELLIFDMLPRRYLRTYEYDRDIVPSETTASEWEWFCRVHLMLDYLSGMTDDYALRTFHAVAGVGYDI